MGAPLSTDFQKRVLLRCERRPLLPGAPDRLGLRHEGVGARLLLAHRVVPLLVGLLLTLLLLRAVLLGPLLLGLLAQCARSLPSCSVVGGRLCACAASAASPSPQALMILQKVLVFMGAFSRVPLATAASPGAQRRSIGIAVTGALPVRPGHARGAGLNDAPAG
jgi:hypothetical protein